MNLDLTLVNTYSLTTLGIADLSIYTTNPTNASCEVTPPQGFNKINVEFVPRVVNIFNSDLLGITCDNTTSLPDGIYKIKYSVHPNTTLWIEKSFMRVEQIKCTYQRAFLAIDTQCDCNGNWRSKYKQQLQDIKLLIEGSVAAANECDIVSSLAMYKQADYLLSKIKLCECN